MGWRIELVDSEGNPLPVGLGQADAPHNVLGASSFSIGVTYNYLPRFREAWDGLGLREALDGRQAAEVIPLLEAGVAKLGDRPDPDGYWSPTPGNAGHALALLLNWARQYPEGVFRVDY